MTPHPYTSTRQTPAPLSVVTLNELASPAATISDNPAVVVGSSSVPQIALPLGYSSCLATCRKTFDGGNLTKNETMGTLAAAGPTANSSKVIPTAEPSPQTP